MEVYEPGTRVVLSDDIVATIVTVAIHSGDYIQYECAWWSGEARTREWFHDSEIEVLNKEDKPRKIGFCAAEV